MQSFRTELENPVVEKEIIDLEKKIRQFQNGALHEDKFKSLRLARGIYGQRQPGVQMVRIKLPFGRVSFKQLLKICDVSDEYAIKNLHLTTRQDIQIHFVSLDRTPELWAQLAEDDITLREACGNTVRNVTASPQAGIDPEEPFDVSPYARATFEYFVRNPICQEMGRKFKIAFSSSDSDTAFAYIHDVGLIPKIRQVNGKEVRGFKVVIGGGLGALPMEAKLAHIFLPEDQVIPFIESTIRVFERLGERNNRNKARFKFLLQQLGVEQVLELIEKERTANKYVTYPIDLNLSQAAAIPELRETPKVDIEDPVHYQLWKKTNVIEQKQKGFFSVYVKITTGDISTEKARILIAGIRDYVADDIRITQNQGLLLKFVREAYLPHIYKVLKTIDVHAPGFDSVADITTCPGTDTCNLGISNSTEMARVLETLIQEKYPELILERALKIKISGCMNSCGQHSLAHIGFHGSSLKAGGSVVPAAQVMLGGATLGDADGRVAERILKVPSKRVPLVLQALLEDFKTNSIEQEAFHNYYLRQGKRYFQDLLKPFSDLTVINPQEFIDWGREEIYKPAIGVGECAGVVIDLVATLLFEAEEKLEWSDTSFSENRYADAVFHAYSAMISAAKALLLDRGIQKGSNMAIIESFDELFVKTSVIDLNRSFQELVTEINKNKPTMAFATRYLSNAHGFCQLVQEFREIIEE